jgi:hypothetical protein
MPARRPGWRRRDRPGRRRRRAGKLRRVLGRLDTVFFLISAATLTGWGQLLGWPGYYIRCTLKVRDL